jgi:hypothetical protein
VENKTAVVLYGAGAVVVLWLSNTVVGAIDAVPLVRPRVWRAAAAAPGAPLCGRVRLQARTHKSVPKLARAPRSLPPRHARTRNSQTRPHPPTPTPPNASPLQIPKLFELVGLGYTAWFVYRYLLFQSSREELVK